MSQSSYIFGALFLAFVVFITAKGELPIYLALMTGQGGSSTNSASAQGAISRVLTGDQTYNPAQNSAVSNFFHMPGIFE